MKTKLILLLALPVVAFAAQNRNVNRSPDACPREKECPQATAISTPTTLPTSELIAAFEEERMAHDLYVAAAARWNLPVFTNIAAAEVRHANAVQQLATSVAATLPTLDTGIYSTPEIQSMYNQLLVLMEGSESGALQAGALVEETDIMDLRSLKKTATDSATLAILGNLERASINHLNAFVSNLAARGITYAPKVMTAEEFAQATSDVASGSCGRGPGAGFRAGAGKPGSGPNAGNGVGPGASMGAGRQFGGERGRF